MSRRPPGAWWALAVLIAGVCAGASVVVARAGTGSGDVGGVTTISVPDRPLRTALVDPDSLSGADADAAYQKLRATGAKFVQIPVGWPGVAPDGQQRPAAFDARNPASPLYSWANVDSQVKLAASHGYVPFVYVQGAPKWAQRCSQGPGPCRPRPKDLADFMTAAARRYSGSFRGVPRVRYWQIWNEPNLNFYLMPQADSQGQPLSPIVYRPLLNAAYDAIHAVRRDNVVAAGSLAAFGNDDQQVDEVAPLWFMRELLCLSRGARPKATCKTRVKFDVWTHHPYTSGGPNHHALQPDDVSAPDLWKIERLLEAGTRVGNIQSRGPVDFWVTEFAWDTNPPDPKGMPEDLHARWVSEVLYRMWDQGVSLVTWFLLRDQPWGSGGPFQSGLYFAGDDGIKSDTPKLALTAFRFPFVAFREPKRKTVMFWGRSPAGRSPVVVEREVNGSWSAVGTMTPNRYGIYSGRYASTATTGFARARLANGKDASLPFSLVVPPDRPGCAWGTC